MQNDRLSRASNSNTSVDREATFSKRGARRGVSIASIAAAALAGSLVTGAVLTASFARSAISADTYRQLDLFGEVFEQVHANYVESPEDAELIEGAINGMMSELDPHSSYLSADDYTRMQEQTRGSFAGLGIQVVMDNEGDDAGYVKIVAPIDGTPASRAGIETNDLIVEIDGSDVQPLTLDQSIALLKGEKGTPVTIKVLRDREAEPFELTLVRDIVRVEAVTSRMEDDFGYVQIRTFSERAGSELKDAIREFEKETATGPKGYILDLRSNPGGLLDQAVAVADVFLEGGEIVSTRGRHARDTMREMGRRGDLTNGKPVIVLINGGSASASEIVAGALQDRNRGLLLGTKSFGKGSVQTVIPLRNGLQGALRLTTARYYTPSGRSIQAQGIVPDVQMPVIYPGQEKPWTRRSEADLENALDVPKGDKSEDETPEAQDEAPQADASEETAEDADKPILVDGVEAVKCGYEEDGETFRDCQLERALEILSDVTAYRALLADAGAPKTQ
ncbi:MAG: S41 family peptidase [Pseudomonadota bacterium]